MTEREWKAFCTERAQRKKRLEGEKERNLGTWLLYVEQVESDTSSCGWHMEPIVATVQEGQGEVISGGAAGSDSLRTWKRQGWWSWRVIQMSVSGQVGHLSQGTGQVALARHAAKVVGDLCWPVIMSWKLSFHHGRLPTAANHALV